MQIPRHEYPRPQFVRENWCNLNGTWQFEIDQGRSGIVRELFKENTPLSGTITVPFCPESKLSGIGYTDFMYGVWYKRKVTLAANPGRTVLHFGAVDYVCHAFVNGREVGTHKGGYVSFSFDITDYVREGENEIAVFAEDNSRDPMIPSGKQSPEYNSFACYYTRTTGIWQTVWLEFTPKTYIKSVKYYPNVQESSVTMDVTLSGKADLDVEVSFAGKVMGTYQASSVEDKLSFTVSLAEAHLWEVGKGNLYDVNLTFGEDKVASYFGLRQVRLEGKKFLLNGKSVFQRLVLDQGFYPDGIYTAPTDEALKNDILLSLAMGFNGARLHEKIFEERFLYHADKLGYLVWGEYPDWGLDSTRCDNIYGILPEWLEEVERDFNHPAIIGWCPHNETHPWQHDDSIALVYKVTKALDPTRPCIDTSGYHHVLTDIYCVHDYEQDPEKFNGYYKDLPQTEHFTDHHNRKGEYTPGQPMFVSEYGGIRWTEDPSGWGYGNAPTSPEEFLDRLEKLNEALLSNPDMLGLCYTQLTDVEQEQNGLYTYDRKPKFDPAIIRPFFTKKAAIED